MATGQKFRYSIVHWGFDLNYMNIIFIAIRIGYRSIRNQEVLFATQIWLQG